jgi:hypothetical protein
MRISKNKLLASKYYELLKPYKKGFLSDLVVKYELPGSIYKFYFKLIPRIKNKLRRFK